MAKKKINKKRFIYIFAILILIIGTSLIIYMNSNFIEFQDQGHSLFSLEDYSKIEVGVRDSNIMLKSNCKAIIVTIPEDRSFNIESALRNLTEIRPSIYESTKEIVNYFDIELAYVKIEKMENNIYYSKAIFSTKDKILNLDMRPSDAIVLAIRLNKPIYINNYLLDNFGTNVC